MMPGKTPNNKSVSFPPPPTALPIPNETMKQAADSKTDVLKMMLGVAHTLPMNSGTVRHFFRNRHL